MGLSNRAMNTRNKVMVFIDGAYLRKYTKEKYGTDLLNYYNLGHKLALTAVGSHPNLIRIYYYDALGSMKDAEKVQDQLERATVKGRTTQLIAEQEKYFEIISKQEFVTIRLGRLVVANKETPRQKGVDILMAIDMLAAAYENQYDWAVLVAGDSDFLELVKKVKHMGVNIMGFYFKDHVAKELVNEFDRRNDLDGFNFEGNNFI